MIIGFETYIEHNSIIHRVVSDIMFCCRKLSKSVMYSPGASKHNVIRILFNERTGKYEVYKNVGRKKVFYTECPFCGDKIQVFEDNEPQELEYD